MTLLTSNIFYSAVQSERKPNSSPDSKKSTLSQITVESLLESSERPTGLDGYHLDSGKYDLFNDLSFVIVQNH